MSETDSDRSQFRRMLAPTNWPIRYQLGAVATLGLAVLPQFIDNPLYLLTVTGALYFGVFAMSWDIVSGYTGNFSFGHAFIFTVGGYTSAILHLEFGLAPVLTILVGTVAAVVAGILLGAPALRLKGPYFAVLTFLIPSILERVLVFFPDVTGGSTGLPPVEALVEGSGFEATAEINYYLALVLFVLVLVVLIWITRSTVGEIFLALREDEQIVSAMGYNPAKYKIYAFGVSAAVGGLGAAMFVHSPVGTAHPSELLAVTISINIILATFVGGIGTISGAAAGGVAFFLLRDQLAGSGLIVPIVDLPVSEYYTILFPAIILVLLYYLPGGLLPWGTRKARALRANVTGAETPDTESSSPLDRYVQTLKERFGGNNE